VPAHNVAAVLWTEEGSVSCMTVAHVPLPSPRRWVAACVQNYGIASLVTAIAHATSSSGVIPLGVLPLPPA
jgi:hypothetical protein